MESHSPSCFLKSYSVEPPLLFLFKQWHACCWRPSGRYQSQMRKSYMAATLIYKHAVTENELGLQDCKVYGITLTMVRLQLHCSRLLQSRSLPVCDYCVVVLVAAGVNLPIISIAILVYNLLSKEIIFQETY